MTNSLAKLKSALADLSAFVARLDAGIEPGTVAVEDAQGSLDDAGTALNALWSDADAREGAEASANRVALAGDAEWRRAHR